MVGQRLRADPIPRITLYYICMPFPNAKRAVRLTSETKYVKETVKIL